jgi:uncharacterized protein (DUF2267 family)
VAQFSAQMPLLVRGMFFEGWTPAHTPIHDRNVDHFIAAISAKVGRGDFGAEEWRDALALATERADSPTSQYLLAHPMAADDIASGLEALGHDHILQDGSY